MGYASTSVWTPLLNSATKAAQVLAAAVSRAVGQFLLFLAIVAMFVALMFLQIKIDEAVSSLEEVQRGEVATPPPEPPNKRNGVTSVLSIYGIDTSRELETFWNRNPPLLL